ncbi:hypothetical protein C8Q80DRAFT_289162 [Daedaleopsis nitida]|nr:hypothetical protein C8Q80DRAFT_289162 [Daedaleopsis nitida]
MRGPPTIGGEDGIPIRRLDLPRPSHHLHSVLGSIISAVKNEWFTCSRLNGVRASDCATYHEWVICAVREEPRRAVSIPLAAYSVRHAGPVIALPARHMETVAEEWAPYVLGTADTPGKHTTRSPYQGLSRQQSIHITQLRCSHLGLNAYLVRIRAVDSPLCQCSACSVPETAAHYMFTCRRF